MGGGSDGGVRRLAEEGEAEVANKGGVREAGVAGWLLGMAWETEGSLVRHGRGAEDDGARPACPREEDEGGAGWLGRPKAEAQWQFRGGGPKRREGRVGQPGWKERRAAAGLNPEPGQNSKEILFEFQFIFRIWQNFRNLHNVIWKGF
jgi:hypothetical protein